MKRNLICSGIFVVVVVVVVVSSFVVVVAAAAEKWKSKVKRFYTSYFQTT